MQRSAVLVLGLSVSKVLPILLRKQLSSKIIQDIGSQHLSVPWKPMAGMWPPGQDGAVWDRWRLEQSLLLRRRCWPVGLTRATIR